MPIEPIRAPSKVQAENREREALLELEKVFPVFPSPKGCSDQGAKLAFNDTLARIAEGMGMSRPKTELLEDLKRPPYGMVLKREFSDTKQDVHVPDQNMDVDKAIRDAASFVRKRTRVNPNDECVWLAQEFVPFLPIGEIRFMCVGGVPIREVVTGSHGSDHPEDPGQLWAYERNEALRTLKELQ
jgi:hypothetical protein